MLILKTINSNIIQQQTFVDIIACDKILWQNINVYKYRI